MHADDEPTSAATDEPQTAANDEPPSAASNEPQTAGTSARIRRNAPKYTFERVPRLPSLDLPIFPEPDYSKYRGFSAIELFELFWDDSLLQSIIEQMELYSAWKNMEIFRPSVGEVRTFLGILLLSGYHKLPQRWMYWSDDEDIGSALVKGSMRKNRFELFMQFLHFADNTNLDVNDRYAKLRPLIQHFRRKFGEHFIPEQYLSHDEALIEYFGHSSLKQHILQKPIRFGYEVFCLNTPSGYLAAFEPSRAVKVITTLI